MLRKVEEQMKGYRTWMNRLDAKKAIEDMRAEAVDLPEMTLDDINAEIMASREERKSRRGSFIQFYSLSQIIHDTI